MMKLRIVSILALLFACGGFANAATSNIGGATAGSDDGRPTRGMTQASVTSKYGQPNSVNAPVGEPPITRWDYKGFVVYFEYDKVIHAVQKR